MTAERFTKARLVEDVAQQTGLTKVDVERTMKAIQDSVIEAVSQGMRVTLPNFVSFFPSYRNGRTMENPKTGKQVNVREKRTVKVKVLNEFAQQVEDQDKE